jgi:hypothetical protein
MRRKPIWISEEAHAWLDASRAGSFANAVDDLIGRVDGDDRDAMARCLILLSETAKTGAISVVFRQSAEDLDQT